jgi:SpoVK/Ycf46/Vps4 family AAA+-type ATPase
MNKPAGTNLTGVPMKRDKDGNEIIDWTKIDTPLKHEGKQITLPGDPENMPYDDAIKVIQTVKQAESQTYAVSERVDGLPWDALVAVFRAMQEIYGVVLPQSMQTWFGDRPPQFVSIKTGPGAKDIVQVPVGMYTLPGMKTPIMVQMEYRGCTMNGEVNKRDRARFVEIAKRAKEIVQEDSIYKGKAIRLLVDKDGDLELTTQPEFFDIRGVSEHDMIHNRVTQSIIETSILSPIKHEAACRKHNIPLKRGILLEGRYGTGKTLTARVTAKVAVDHGWTFIVIARAEGLSAALSAAQRYQPAVVFAEDIDRFGDRSKESVNDLVNMMDGLVPANAAVMTVLTTNFVETIDKALLRPGRLDAVVSIDAPDGETVGRLIRLYGAELLSDDVELEQVGYILSGQIPATVAEVVKRAKLAMLTEDREALTEADLVTAAESMKRHLALLEGITPPKSKGDALAEALRGVVLDADVVTDFFNRMEAIARQAQKR